MLLSLHKSVYTVLTSVLSWVLVWTDVLDRKNRLVQLGLACSATQQVSGDCGGALALDDQKDRKTCGQT